MAEAPTGWRSRGDYAIWGGNCAADQAPYILHEWCEKGVIAIPHRTGRPIVHRIARGVPFHVSRLFGFWIEHDVDAVWIESPAEDGTHYALMVGGSIGKPEKTVLLFVCPRCAAQFGRETVPFNRQGHVALLERALERVREFNADMARRACPKCGATHPPTYGFYAEKDDAAERAARQAG